MSDLRLAILMVDAFRLIERMAAGETHLTESDARALRIRAERIAEARTAMPCNNAYRTEGESCSSDPCEACPGSIHATPPATVPDAGEGEE